MEEMRVFGEASPGVRLLEEMSLPPRSIVVISGEDDWQYGVLYWLEVDVKSETFKAYRTRASTIPSR